jgi:hypothetical protein
MRLAPLIERFNGMERRLSVVGVAAALAYSGAAGATLIDRGNGLIYDSVLNITWLQNADPASGRSFNWFDALAWATDLSFDGLTGWRLPSVGPDHGPEGPATGPPFDCSTGTAVECAASGNELGYMFYYNLGGTRGSSKTGNQTTDGVTLNNIQPAYWASTLAHSGSFAWIFGFGESSIFGAGGQDLVLSAFPDSGASVWAVRPGDVSAAVPAPATLALVALGLAGLSWRRRTTIAGAHG